MHTGLVVKWFTPELFWFTPELFWFTPETPKNGTFEKPRTHHVACMYDIPLDWKFCVDYRKVVRYVAIDTRVSLEFGLLRRHPFSH